MKDFKDLRGLQIAIRAIEIAVVGNHCLLIVGDAGTGKTALARAICDVFAADVYDDALPSKRGGMEIEERPTIVTARPCLCGNFLDPKRACHCNTHATTTTFHRIWQDIDMLVAIFEPELHVILDGRPGESSDAIGKRIVDTIPVSDVKKHPGAEALALLKSAYLQLPMPPGEIFRVANVSRTIAAMSGLKEIGPEHMAEAIQYRGSRCLTSLKP